MCLCVCACVHVCVAAVGTLVETGGHLRKRQFLGFYTQTLMAKGKHGHPEDLDYIHMKIKKPTRLGYRGL